MPENISNLTKAAYRFKKPNKLQTRKTPKKSTPSHIIVKLLKKDTVKILKALREKLHCNYRKNTILVTPYFISEIQRPEGNGSTIFSK